MKRYRSIAFGLLLSSVLMLPALVARANPLVSTEYDAYNATSDGVNMTGYQLFDSRLESSTYMAQPYSNVQFTVVSMTVTLPLTLATTDPEFGVYTWVGLSGADLWQAGVGCWSSVYNPPGRLTQSCDTFYEDVPDRQVEPIPNSFTPHLGDTIYEEVTYDPSTQYGAYYLKDLTTNSPWAVGGMALPHNDVTHTALWFDEAHGTYGYNLAGFGATHVYGAGFRFMSDQGAVADDISDPNAQWPLLRNDVLTSGGKLVLASTYPYQPNTGWWMYEPQPCC